MLLRVNKQTNDPTIGWRPTPLFSLIILQWMNKWRQQSAHDELRTYQQHLSGFSSHWRSNGCHSFINIWSDFLHSRTAGFFPLSLPSAPEIWSFQYFCLRPVLLSSDVLCPLTSVLIVFISLTQIYLYILETWIVSFICDTKNLQFACNHVIDSSNKTLQFW